MHKIVLAAAAAAALFVFPGAPSAHAATSGLSETSAQVSVQVGDGHRRWESRRKREWRRRHRDCRTVRSVTWVHGKKIVKVRRSCD